MVALFPTIAVSDPGTISDQPPAVYYPESDGQPMADNTKQFRWITVIYYNLEWLFAQNEQVFVAGDLLWYPVEGNNKIRQAPDVMVVFGVAKGDRGSYQQWKEGNIPPQVVFEILSPGNTLKEMYRKQSFYDRYGVEEYYVYDPDRNELTVCVRAETGLEVMDSLKDWVSPRLGICFQHSESTLRLLRPDGTPFVGYTEIAQQLDQERERAEQALQLLDAERDRAEQALQLLDAERERADRLAQRLREMGIDPETF